MRTAHSDEHHEHTDAVCLSCSSCLSVNSSSWYGRYSFNQLNGVSATGDYIVRLTVTSGFTQTSANPSTILISRGDINVRGVNFTLASTSQAASPSTSHTASGGNVSTTSGALDPTLVDALSAATGSRD